MTRAVGQATAAWPADEDEPERAAILSAADRLLAGTPHRSTGRLSIVQLAVEADVKYWVVAQKHPDLRDHFKHLTANANHTPPASAQPTASHNDELKQLKQHCDSLEDLVRTYAAAINELDLENQALRAQLQHRTGAVVIPLHRTRTDPR